MEVEEGARFPSLRNYHDIELEDEDRLWTDEELDLFEQQEEEFQQRANELTQRINNFILSLVCISSFLRVPILRIRKLGPCMNHRPG